MSDHDQEPFEAELRRLSPAKLPDHFTERLIDARSEIAAQPCAAKTRPSLSSLFRAWLFQVMHGRTATFGVATLIVLLATGAILLKVGSQSGSHETHLAQARPVRADDVEIDRQLVDAFDAVATMPDGEPVRVRCQQWIDEVVLRDNKHGVAIQQRTPRFEVIPLRFETF